MNHSMPEPDSAKANEDDNPLETVHTDCRYRDEPFPRAKPHQRITRGIPIENFFGICAEEFDDEFMESLREIRRGVRPREPRS
jgi:hypothetical protein